MVVELNVYQFYRFVIAAQCADAKTDTLRLIARLFLRTI